MMKEKGKTKSEKVPVLRSICEGGWTSLLFTFSLLLFTFTAEATYRSSLGVSSGYDFFSYGDKGWYVTDGGMRSGASLDHSKSSSLVTCIKGPAILVFDWKVSSESNCDKLHLYDNGTSKDNISGTVDWTTKTYVIESGTHVIRWTYSKDGSVTSGSDCGWVRNVGIVTTSPTTLLPNGCRLRTYIYTEGASYLDTGYTHTASTWVLGDFYVYTKAASSHATTGQKWGCLFGARNGDYKKNSMAFFSRDYDSKSRYCRTGSEHQFTYPGNGYWQIVCTGKNCYLGNGDNAFALHTSSGTADGGTCPMFIGDVNKSTTTGGKTAEGSRVKMNVNHFTILSSENVVAKNMIPCVDTLGEAGLWDNVAGVFRTSETSTGFTAFGMYYLVQCNADGGTFPDESSSVYVWQENGAAMSRIPTLASRTGYVLQGFYSGVNGQGTKYYNADGTSAKNCDLTKDATLYAYWQGNPYTVTLDAQGGAGGTESVTATYGAAMPSATMPTKAGYTFAGYFDATTGGTKYYNADGTSAANWDKDSATTLYAQWEATAIPVEGDVSVKVDDKWIKDNNLEDATDEQIADELKKTDADGTGLKKWQNWALGVTDGDKDAKPAFTGAAKSATEGKVSFAVPGYTGNGKSGVTATRKLVKKVGADETETPLALDAEAVVVDEGDVSAATPVALYTTVIAFSNASGAEVKSENTVGVMYVKTPAQKAMVAVPWEQIGGGEISAADLIDTRDLADGDLLHVYDKANSQYRTWTLKGGAWSPLGTRKIEAGKVSELSAGDPGEATIARGDGVWLERGDATKPFHLIGQYNAAKVQLPSESGWNICGNAGIEKANVADLGAGDGDTIIVPTEAEPIRYTKKDNEWGRYVETVTEIEINGRKVKTSKWTEGGEIGVGQGFWLVK